MFYMHSLSLSDRNLDVMNEILVENEPGKESEDDFSLMQELNTTMRSMQERVTILIGRVQDEIVMGKGWILLFLCCVSLLFRESPTD